MTYLVIKTPDAFGAKTIAKLARQLKAKATILSHEEAEEWLLGKLVSDDKTNKKEVSRELVAKHFAKYGITI